MFKYRKEKENLVKRYDAINHSLNVNKMKEIVIDFRKHSGGHAPVYINGDEVEMVDSFKFLAVQITNNLSWSPHADTIVKKAHQRLYFLRRLRKFDMSATTLTNFYRCTIESILSGCITAWYGSCSAQDRKKLHKVVNVVQSITQTSLPSIDSVYTSHCLGKASSIIKDPTHPRHTLFYLLPSGKRCKSLRTCTNLLKNSFFPAVIRLLNGATIY